MRLITKQELKDLFNTLIEKHEFSIEQAIDYLMEKLKKDYLIKNFNGVYVYMGTYKLVHKYENCWYPAHERLVAEDDPTKEYKMFYELDTGLQKCINVGQELEMFEQGNTIVVIPNVRNYENKATFKQDYEKLRRIYLKELCLKDEESALSIVTSEEYIKQEFSIEKYLIENNISLVFYDAFYEVALCNKKDSNIVSDKKLILNNK